MKNCKITSPKKCPYCGKKPKIMYGRVAGVGCCQATFKTLELWDQYVDFVKYIEAVKWTDEVYEIISDLESRGLYDDCIPLELDDLYDNAVGVRNRIYDRLRGAKYNERL